MPERGKIVAHRVKVTATVVTRMKRGFAWRVIGSEGGTFVKNEQPRQTETKISMG